MFEIVNPLVECVESSERYGRFITEPLERGMGTTLGNALRRVLLGSLPGAAVTWVMIEGVQHEFSTIPNVKEDVSEFLLNVKAIRLRPVTSSDGKLTLEAVGEGRVLAGNITPSADFEVVNPGLHLATLDSPDSRLVMDFNVELDKGYRPAGRQDHGANLPIGMIPVDAIFTPILKVNYAIEPTLAGQLSGYERLTLEVWTDGTISPIEAVGRSAQILTEKLQLFYELAKAPPMVSEAQPGLSIPPEQYDMPIEQLGLTMRTFNCLKRAKITKIGELLEKGDEELLNIRNFGQKALDEVHQQLKALGLVAEEALGDVESGETVGEVELDIGEEEL